MVGFNFAPRGWALCDGQILPISSNSALFSLLGTTYGGDGRTTFALPDLRGRVPIQVGNGPGLSPYQWGEKGGAETNILNVNQLPPHSHTFNLPATEEGNTDSPENAFVAGDGNASFGTASDITMATSSTNNTGAASSINNIQPFLGIYFIIALQGIFPSRS